MYGNSLFTLRQFNFISGFSNSAETQIRLQHLYNFTYRKRRKSASNSRSDFFAPQEFWCVVRTILGYRKVCEQPIRLIVSTDEFGYRFECFIGISLKMQENVEFPLVHHQIAQFSVTIDFVEQFCIVDIQTQFPGAFVVVFECRAQLKNKKITKNLHKFFFKF